MAMRKTEGGVSYPSSAYLIVEDAQSPGTWHLRVRDATGKVDHRLLGASFAALHGGYRGNKYEGPNKQEAIGKLRKIYEREGMPVPAEKSFTVFKSADGSYRWLARSTTAYRDRDGEIITTKALEQDAARMTATQQYGPLRYWHIGQPDPFNPTAPWGIGVDIGDCDYSTVIGRTSIESGTFKDQQIGRAFAESADDYEISPGFFHPLDEPNAAGEYENTRRFERSVVPIKYGRASNLFTGLTVKEHRMDQQTYEQRMKAFAADMNAKGVPPEVAGAVVAGMEQADKSATEQGIAFKSEDQPADPWAVVIAAFKAAVAPIEKAMAPASMEQAGLTEMDDGMEEVADEGDAVVDDTGGEYIGDMSPAEFKALLTEVLAPVLRMQDMHKAMTDAVGEMKAMMGGYTTKDAGAATELAALKADQQRIANRLAELEGNRPAIVNPADIEAALKGAPQAPPDPSQPQLPADATPVQRLAAQTMPALYSTGQNGQWAGWQPPTPLPQS